MDAALISSLRKPAANARVFKEECMFSFITHAAPDGIFVNLQTFQVRYQCHRAFLGSRGAAFACPTLYMRCNADMSLIVLVFAHGMRHNLGFPWVERV